MSDHSDKRLVLVSAPTQAVSESPSGVERRKVVRYPFTAEVEAADLRLRTRLIGRTSDLGLGGCYIDTISPFATGAVVRLRITSDEQVLEAMATVTYALASMGMGLAFTEISKENTALLRTWIAHLSGESLPASEKVETEPESKEAAAVLHLQQVLNELIALMIRNKIIKETEGAALLRQLFS